MKALGELLKEQFHKEGKAQKKGQYRSGAGRLVLSHSKNAVFKSQALYRAQGMTQQAVEWQPVWAHAALEAAHSHSPLLATELQLSYEK